MGKRERTDIAPPHATQQSALKAQQTKSGPISVSVVHSSWAKSGGRGAQGRSLKIVAGPLLNETWAGGMREGDKEKDREIERGWQKNTVHSFSGNPAQLQSRLELKAEREVNGEEY